MYKEEARGGHSDPPASQQLSINQHFQWRVFFSTILCNLSPVSEPYRIVPYHIHNPLFSNMTRLQTIFLSLLLATTIFALPNPISANIKDISPYATTAARSTPPITNEQADCERAGVCVLLLSLHRLLCNGFHFTKFIYHCPTAMPIPPQYSTKYYI
jgi:hypothetical protein